MFPSQRWYKTLSWSQHHSCVSPQRMKTELPLKVKLRQDAGCTDQICLLGCIFPPYLQLPSWLFVNICIFWSFHSQVDEEICPREAEGHEKEKLPTKVQQKATQPNSVLKLFINQKKKTLNI